MKIQSSESDSITHAIALGGPIPPPAVLSWHGMWGMALLVPLGVILFVQLRWGVNAVPLRAVLYYAAIMLPLAVLLRQHHTNEKLLEIRRVREERIRQLEMPAPRAASALHDVLTVELRGPIEEHRLRRDAAECRARQRSDLAVVVVVLPALLLLASITRELPTIQSTSWTVGAVGAALMSPFALVAGVLWRAARKEWDMAAASGSSLDRMQAVLAALRVTEFAGHGPTAVDVKQLLSELCSTSSKGPASGTAQ